MSNFETMMNQPICDCPPSDVPTCRPPHPPIPPCPPCPPKDRNTPWYGLPQWSPATTVSFLVTMNNAMMCIDSALHNLALRTGIDGVPSDLVTTVEKLELETKDLKMRISELNVDSDNFELKLANMTKSITTIQTDISTLIINTSNLDTRMTTQEMKSTQFNGTLTKLQENIASIMETVGSINEQYQQMLQEHQDIRNDINTAQLDIANLKLKDTELEGKIAENTTNITANDKDIEKLQTDLAVTTTSVAANTKAITDISFKKVSEGVAGNLNPIFFNWKTKTVHSGNIGTQGKTDSYSSLFASETTTLYTMSLSNLSITGISKPSDIDSLGNALRLAYLLPNAKNNVKQIAGPVPAGSGKISLRSSLKVREGTYRWFISTDTNGDYYVIADLPILASDFDEDNTLQIVAEAIGIFGLGITLKESGD